MNWRGHEVAIGERLAGEPHIGLDDAEYYNAVLQRCSNGPATKVETLGCMTNLS